MKQPLRHGLVRLPGRASVSPLAENVEKQPERISGSPARHLGMMGMALVLLLAAFAVHPATARAAEAIAPSFGAKGETERHSPPVPLSPEGGTIADKLPASKTPSFPLRGIGGFGEGKEDSETERHSPLSTLHSPLASALSIDPGSISGDQTLCGPGTPAALASDVPASGHDGYLWQRSTDGGATWTAAPGTNGQETYQPGTLSQTTLFRRMATSAADGDEGSGTVTITVSPLPPAPIALPTQTFCAGATLAELATTAGGDIKWYTAPTGGTLLPSTTLLAHNADYYASQTVDGCESALRAKVHAVVVTLTAGQIGSDKTVCQGTDVGLSNLDGGSNNGFFDDVYGWNARYRWESSKDGGASWHTAPNGIGVNNAGYTYFNIQEDTRFRRWIVRTVNGVTCEALAVGEPTITVNWVEGGEVAGSQAFDHGGHPANKLTSVAPGTGAGDISYRWERSGEPNGQIGAQVGGYEEEYQPTTSDNQYWGHRYHRVTISDLDGMACQAASNALLMPMHSIFASSNWSGGANPGAINGLTQTICAGDTPALLTSTAEAAGQSSNHHLLGLQDTISYQWERQQPNGDWADIPGATALDYQPSSIYAKTIFRRRAISTLLGHVAVAWSNTVTVTATIVSPGIIKPVSTIVCRGDNVSIASTVDPSSNVHNALGHWYYIRWQQSTDGGITWTNVPGGSVGYVQNYTAINLTTDTKFRRLVFQYQDTDTCWVVSNEVAITVNWVDGGKVAGSQGICWHAPALQKLTSVIPGTGAGDISYRWERGNSPTSGLGNINVYEEECQPDPNYLRDQGYYYRRVAISTLDGSICEASSDTLRIAMHALQNAAGAISAGASQTICPGEVPKTLTSAAPAKGQLPEWNLLGMQDTISYQWEIQLPSGSWADIPGATALDYQPDTLDQTTNFRRRAISTLLGHACAAWTGTVTVTVNRFYPGIIGHDRTVCQGTNVAFSSVNHGDWFADRYQWEYSEDGGASWTNVPGGSAGHGNNYTHMSVQKDTRLRRWYIKALNGVTCKALAEGEPVVTVNWVDPGEVAGSQAFDHGGHPANKLTSVAPGTGAGDISYRWERSGEPNGQIGAQVGGYEEEYQPTTSDNQYWGHRYHRVTISDLDGMACQAASNALLMPMHSIFASSNWSGGANPGAINGLTQIICAGDTPALLTSTAEAAGQSSNHHLLGLQDTISYQWERQQPNGDWADIPGATALDYQPSAIYANTIFRRRAISTLLGHVAVAWSNTVRININGVNAGTIGNDHVICTGGTAARLRSKNGDFGNSQESQWWPYPPNYFWLTSTDSISWSLVPGQSGSEYDPGVLTVDTWYRRGRMSTIEGITCTDTANIVKVSMNYISPGQIAAAQVVCVGSRPDTLLSATAPAGFAAPTFQWYQNGQEISGATTENYRPGPLTATTRYSRKATSTVLTGGAIGFCSAFSNELVITVNPVTPGAIGGTQTICEADIPATLTSNTAANTGQGTIAYRWERSTDGWATHEIIPGTDPQAGSHSPAAALPQSTEFRRVAIATTTGGVVCEAVTAPAVVTVNAVSGGEISASQIICAGDAPAALISLAPGESEGTVSYRWARSTDGGANWPIINGQTGVNLTPGTLTASTLYRRVAVSVRNGKTCTANANDLAVTVNTVSPGSISASQTICAGTAPAKLASGGKGSSSLGGTVSHLWEYSTDGGTNWLPAPGTNTEDDYQPGTLFATTQYRRMAIAASDDCAVPTATVTITVTTTTAPGGKAEQTFCTADAPQLMHLQVSGSGIKWYADPTGGSPISNTTHLQDGSTYYASRMASGCESLARLPVKAVLNDVDGGGISASQTICTGETPALLTSATEAAGKGSLEYYWQRSTNGGASWTNISITDGEYAPGALSVATRFRRAAVFTLSGKACTAFSDPAIITVNKVAAGNIAASHVVCADAQPNNLTSQNNGSGDGVPSYSWQRSTDGGANWTLVGGAESAAYQPGVLSATTMFRRWRGSTLDAKFCEVPTTPVTVTLNTVDGGVITGLQTICEGAAPSPLASDSPGTGTGNISYRWERSTDGGASWTAIPGTDQLGYAPPGPMAATTRYRRVAISTIGSDKCENPSNEVEVTVTVVSAPTGDAVQTFCGTGATLASLQVNGGGGTIRWYDAATGGNLLDGTTLLAHGHTYYASRQPNGCESLARLSVTAMLNTLNAGSIGGAQMLCSGAGKTVNLTSTTPASGVSGADITYRWEQSTDGGANWSVISGTAPKVGSLTTGIVLQTTRYRRVAIAELNGLKCEAASAPVTITVNTVEGGTIAANQTLCFGETPAALTSDAPGSGDGTLTYRWEYSSDGGGSWLMITGEEGEGYAPPALFATAMYRRVTVGTFSEGSCDVPSNEITITVNTVDAGEISGAQTICEGTVPDELISDMDGSAPTGAAITHYWEFRPAGGSWARLQGATAASYQAVLPLSVTTDYRRVTESTLNGVLCKATSNEVTVTVTIVTPPTGSTEQAFCAADAPTVAKLSATGNGIKWYLASAGGSPLDDTIALVHNTTYYASRMSGVCESVSRLPVKVLLNEVVGGQITANQTICFGETPVALISAIPGSGDGTLTYRWEYSADGGASWHLIIPDGEGEGYAPPALFATALYRRITVGTFATGACEALSNEVTIWVNTVDAGKISGAQTICEGAVPDELISDMDGSAPTGAAITHYWEFRPAGGTWARLQGATAASYQAILPLSVTTDYRRVTESTLNGKLCEATSNEVTVTATIVTAPTGSAVQAFCAADTPTVAKLSAAGTGIKWYLASAGGPPLDDTIALVHNTSYYASRMANGCESVARLAVTVRINEADGGEIATGQTICTGSTPALLTSVNDGSAEGDMSHYWQRSTNGGTSWATIAGATDPTYQPGPLTANTMYRRVTVSTIVANACEAASNPVAITINWATGGTISSDRTVCEGDATVALFSSISGSGASGGSLAYRWEQSTDGGTNWDPIPGAVDEDYALSTALTTTTQFRRAAISTLNGQFCEAVSNPVTVTVNKVSGGTIGGSQEVCLGTAPTLLTSVTDGMADGERGYRWQMLPEGATDWTTIPGATDKDYLPEALLGETKYRRMTVSKQHNVECTALSGEVTVKVTAAPAPTGTATQIFCAEDAPTIAQLQAAGSLIKWYATPTGGTPLSAIAPLVHNTPYYASQAVDGCESAARLKVTALLNTVNPGTITGDQAICADTRPAMLGNSAVATALGAITYRWEQSTDGWLTWDTIPGTPPKVATYWPGKLTVTTEFRRVAISTTTGGICEAASAPATVTVNDIYGGTIQADQTICAGEVPGTLVSDILPDGSGNITYHWESSTNGTNWAKINGAEAEEYTSGPLAATMFFRRVVTGELSGKLCADPSNAVTITVNKVSGGAIAAHQTICEGDVPKHLASEAEGSGDGDIAYLWEYSTDNGSTWDTAPGTANEAGYQPAALTATTLFRRATSSVLDGLPCWAFSNEVTISVTVLTAPTGSAVQVFCAADAPTVADLKAVGSGIKWYDVPTGGAALNGTAVLAHNKTYYASRMASGCESLARLEVKAVLNEVEGGAVSSGQTICTGNVPDLLTSDANGSGSGDITYYWQRSTDGGANWATIVGAAAADHQPGALSTSTLFRRVTVSTIGGNACEAMSNEVAVTVNWVSPGILTGNQTVCMGTYPAEDMEATTDADGGGALSYYWESSTDGGATWDLIIGAEDAAYLPPAPATTTLFRRWTVSTVGTKECEAVSNAVTVTVLTDCAVGAAKTVTDASGNNMAEGGELLEYAIVVTNGFDRPVELSVADGIPANTTFVSASAGGTLSGGHVSWHNATVPANAASTFTFTVRVADDLTGITEIKSAATVTGDPAEMPAPQEPEANIVTNPIAAHVAKKAVADADGDGLAQPGEVLAYTITVRNTGSVDLTGVEVSDVIPESTAYVAGSTTGGGTLASGTPGQPDTLRWTIDIPFGQQKELTFKVKAADDLTGIDLISNSATVRGEATHPADIAVDRAEDPVMALTKRVVDPARIYQLSEKIAYTITVKNTGNVALANISVTDPNADDSNVGHIASLAPGATEDFTAWHKVTQADMDAGRVKNTAHAVGKDPDGNDVARKSVETTAYTSLLSGMEVTKSVADRTKTYGLGDVIAYVVTVRNAGNLPLEDIAVTDANADDPDLGHIANLAPGAKESFPAWHTVTLADVEKGQVDNIAEAVGKDPDGEEVSASSKDPDCGWCPSTGVPVDPGDARGLKVTKTADRTKEYAKVGDVIEYRIRVENTSGVTLTDILIVDHNTDNVKIVDGLADVVVKYPDLAPKMSQEVLAWHAITQEDVERGSVHNIGLVQAKTPDGGMARARSVDGDPCGDCPVDPGCPDCTVVRIKQHATVTLAKEAVNAEGPFEVGDKIQYALKVENTGNVPLTGIEVTDPNADDPNLGAVPNLAPGASAPPFTAWHTVTQADMDAGQVLNTAKAIGKAPNGAAVTAEASSTVRIWQAEPKITLVKDVADDGNTAYRLGDRITYAITVTNTGNVPLTDIAVTDGNADDPDVGKVASLPPGEDHMFTARHTVTQADLDKGYVLNIALAAGKDPKGREVTAESASTVFRAGEDPIDPDCPTCTVTELYTIKAADDHYEVVWLEGRTVGSMLDNDRLNGRPVDPADVLLQPLASPHAGMRMDRRDGTIVLDPSVVPGSYAYPYRICEVADPGNCSQAVATVVVLPNERMKVFVPNAFTPNGDGVNDAFEIIGMDALDRVDLVVINRWGSEVYHCDKYENDWTGEGLNSGTYYYIVTLHKDGKKEIVKGSVLLAK